MTSIGSAVRTDHWVQLTTRGPIVLLTLTTAAIHASLEGWLFAMNAVGYSALATLMIVPGPIGRYRWLVRLALLGFTAATIAGWVIFGSRFWLAYVDKAVELAVVAFLAIELVAIDGGPREIAVRLLTLVRELPAEIRRGLTTTQHPR